MAVLLALSLAAPVHATEPTLARLSFWMPPEKKEAFARIYAEKLVPLLKAHSLHPSATSGRATVDSVFSRLFELTSATAILRTDRQLRDDPAWQQALRELAGPFHFPADSARWYRFYHYSGPAGPGKETIAGAGMHQGLWHTFGIHDGLPSYGVDRILQDSRGDIWLSTTVGIPCRYDGERFISLSAEDGLPDNWVVPRLKDSQGNIWFSAQNALSRYDGEKFTTFTAEDGLPEGWVSARLEDRQGNIWISDQNAMSRYDARQDAGKRFTTFTAEDGLPEGWVSAIFEDRQGNLWLAIGTSVYRYDYRPNVDRQDVGKPFAIFATKDELLSSEGKKDLVLEDPFYSINTIVEDRQGSIWFATYGAGVIRYDGEEFANFATEDGLPSNDIESATVDREGNLWFGSPSAGATRYDNRRPVGERFTTFTTEDGLGGNQIEAIFEDRDGFLWFGTFSGGITRYDGVQFAQFTTRDGLPSSFVFSAAQDRNDNLWFGARDGLSRYDGEEFVNFTTKDGLAGERVTSILEDSRGNLWFGTRQGISRYDGEKFVNLTIEDGLSDNAINAIAEDQEGNLWFATQAGVSRYDGEKFVNFTTQDGLIDNTVTGVFADRSGNLLFTGENGGISQYNSRQGVGARRTLRLRAHRRNHPPVLRRRPFRRDPGRSTHRRRADLHRRNPAGRRHDRRRPGRGNLSPFIPRHRLDRRIT